MIEVASLAFWGFVAVSVVANVWRDVVMRRETETTIRAAIEKGQQLDPATLDKLLKSTRRRRGGADGLMVSGGVTLATGLGLPILGYFVSRGGEADAFYPLLGSGILVSLIGGALLVLSAILRRRHAENTQGTA